MTYEQIRYDVADRVATITLHRPDRLNAWTPLMCEELLDALDRTDADDAVRTESRPTCPASTPWWPDRPFAPLDDRQTDEPAENGSPEPSSMALSTEATRTQRRCPGMIGV